MVKDKKIIGFLVDVPAGKEGEYQINYIISRKGSKVDEILNQAKVTFDVIQNDNKVYELHVQKQSGIDKIPWLFTVRENNKVLKQELSLSKDTIISPK